jgi:hypothetical protein
MAKMVSAMRVRNTQATFGGQWKARSVSRLDRSITPSARCLTSSGIGSARLQLSCSPCLADLYAAAKRAVVEATEGRQTPWFARNDMVGDFVPF